MDSFHRTGFRWTFAAALIAVLATFACSAGEMRYRTSGKVAAYFEKAKRNESTLIAFLHKMPKGADLHNHPAGAVSTETILEAALERGLYFDRESKFFVKEKPSGPHFTPEEMRQPFWNTAEVLEAISHRNLELAGESGHKHFFKAFDRYMAALPDQLTMFREVFARAANQGILYLELMDFPGKAPDWAGEVDRVRREVLADFAARGKYPALEVRFSYPLLRISDLDSFRAQVDEAMRVVTANPELMSGITILQPEDDWTSQRNFSGQMRIIDQAFEAYSRAHREDPIRNPPPPKLNLHAGELTMEYAAYESMLDRISKTIELGHASRIGHGTSIQWEDDVYDLLRLMRDRGIAVEICLSSSEGILKVAGGDRHPFRLYWDAGVPVVLATDDEGISRSNLTREFAKAARWFDLSYGEMKWLAFASLEYSFLPGESLFVNGDFNCPRSDAPGLLEASRKAYLQCLLLNAFSEYEADMERVIVDFGW